MSDWPVVPTRQAIRTAVGEVLSPVGYRNIRRDTFQRKISADLAVQLRLNGNQASQSISLGAISLPANRLAVEVWTEVGRKWSPGPRQLFAGVPLGQTCFRQGYVLDATGRQRFWYFFQLPAPGSPNPVALDDFCRDACEIAVEFARATPDLRAALNNSLIERHADELEPTVYAILNDRGGFEASLAGLRDLWNAIELRMKADDPSIVFVRSRTRPDYEVYFEALRRRCFTASANG